MKPITCFRVLSRQTAIGLVVLLFTTTHSLLAQWVQTNGPYGGSILSLAVSGTNLFAGTSGGGVWRRPLSEMITSVESGSSIPSRFVLEQNYPNPFNPTTTIRYEVPVASKVTLKVYDVLGREVRTLVDEQKGAGYYEAILDASRLASGVYFYRMEAVGNDGVASFHNVRKFVLLR